jgi:hypothetical protein
LSCSVNVSRLVPNHGVTRSVVGPHTRRYGTATRTNSEVIDTSSLATRSIELKIIGVIRPRLRGSPQLVRIWKSQ